MIRDAHGSVPRRTWRQEAARRRHENLCRSGLVGLVPSGHAQLPGLAAKSQLQLADSFYRAFALVLMPDSGFAWSAVDRDPPAGLLSAPVRPIFSADTCAIGFRKQNPSRPSGFKAASFRRP